MKKFNTTGLCVPNMHYMVDISAKLAEIKAMINEGLYFAINRGRQYGKTTTFASVKKKLSEFFNVITVSFEDLGNTELAAEENFVEILSDLFLKYAQNAHFESKAYEKFEEYTQKQVKRAAFTWLSKAITDLCNFSDKPVILLIDEVDQAAGYPVFLKFLGMLRKKYLDRNAELDTTFQSVILAGVYDIRNLKLKLRPDEVHQYNSPWNIASDFDVDMSFNPAEIATMLQDYENDHHTGMDIPAISAEIHRFTNGYPFLVSAVCKIIDEELNQNWHVNVIHESVKILLASRNTLFDDITKKITSHKRLGEYVYRLLVLGASVPYNVTDDDMDLGIRFGILSRHRNGTTRLTISNCIFETWLYNYLTQQSDFLIPLQTSHIKENQFIRDSILSMETVLQKFAEFMHSEHRDSDEKFVEQNARLLFLSFLKPIINGTGSYYVEAETRDYQRMDVVVFYEKKEYIIELKIWHGEKLENDAYDQLCSYLDSRNQKDGYLLNFCFNKEKITGYNGWLEHGGKNIFEATVLS